MSDYYTESQMQRIEQAAYDGAMLEAGKEWERQRDELGETEAELQSSIAELEGFMNQLIEAAELLAEYCAYETGKIAWDALVKDWKEREE